MSPSNTATRQLAAYTAEFLALNTALDSASHGSPVVVASRWDWLAAFGTDDLTDLRDSLGQTLRTASVTGDVGPACRLVTMWRALARVVLTPEAPVLLSELAPVSSHAGWVDVDATRANW